MIDVYIDSDVAALWSSVSLPWVALWKGIAGEPGWRLVPFLYGMSFLLIGLPVLMRARCVGRSWGGWLGVILGAVRWTCPIVWVGLCMFTQTKPASSSPASLRRIWLLGAPLALLSYLVRSPASYVRMGHPEYMLAAVALLWLLLAAGAVVWIAVVTLRGRLGISSGLLLAALCAAAPEVGVLLTLRELFREPSTASAMQSLFRDPSR